MGRSVKERKGHVRMVGACPWVNFWKYSGELVALYCAHDMLEVKALWNSSSAWIELPSKLQLVLALSARNCFNLLVEVMGVGAHLTHSVEPLRLRLCSEREYKFMGGIGCC